MNVRMHWVYYFGRILIHILLFPVAFLRVKGRENVPGPGPYLIVCNHNHIADPPIVGTCFKHKSVFMAKSELWNNAWSRFWVENYGAFPIHRGGVDREAVRHAEKWVMRGVSVIMFPEGTRSRNGQMQQALPGSVLLATRLGVPILPVGITGSDKLRKLRWAFLHHPTITVNIGKPFDLPKTDGKLTREERRRLIIYIMGHVAELLPPEYRGVYAGEKNAQD